jgi:phage baseplate assembly protein W
MNPSFPWRIGSNGLTGADNQHAHVRAMIEQLLLTNAGERVNRPDMGGGLYQLVFAPNSPQLSATLQLTLQANVQRYLADVVDVGSLHVTSIDERMVVEVNYRLKDTAVDGSARIELPMAAS